MEPLEGCIIIGSIHIFKLNEKKCHWLWETVHRCIKYVTKNKTCWTIYYIKVFQNSPNMLKTNQPSKKDFDWFIPSSWAQRKTCWQTASPEVVYCGGTFWLYVQHTPRPQHGSQAHLQFCSVCLPFNLHWYVLHSCWFQRVFSTIWSINSCCSVDLG